VFDDILTERLVLRQLLPSDAASLYSYRSHPSVTAYQTWEPRAVDEVRSFIHSLQERNADVPGAWYQVGIALRASRELIGDCGIHPVEDDPRVVELGITLSPSHRSRGYAGEALRALLEHLFTRLGKHRVFGSVDPRNRASMALFQRVGFRYEGHLVKSLWFKTEWADEAIFALLDSDWASLAASPPSHHPPGDD